MTRGTKALLLLGIQLGLLLGLGGKYLVERRTRPRFWLKTAPVDPNLPIRGRYVSLRVEVLVRGAEMAEEPRTGERWFMGRRQIPVRLVPEDGALIAHAQSEFSQNTQWATLSEGQRSAPKEAWVVQLEPLAYFIPEGVPDPSLRAPGEELWVEATLPRKGPLRPIRLAVKKAGRLEPLGF